jgi:hypothetical protein
MWKLDYEGRRSLGPSLCHEDYRLDDVPPLPRHMGRENLPLEELGKNDMTIFYLIGVQ